MYNNTQVSVNRPDVYSTNEGVTLPEDNVGVTVPDSDWGLSLVLSDTLLWLLW